MPKAPKTIAHRARLGVALRTLRARKGWTLAEVSRRTGFSVPTLSKVEHDKLSLSYDKLIRLSEGLAVDIAELFTPADGAALPETITGRRSVNRLADGELIGTRNYDYHYLSSEVNRKKFIPIVTELHARSLAEFGELVRHSGDEFIFVIEGAVELHTDLYAPVLLNVGESAYIDSRMGHVYLAGARGRCRMLAVCSASEQELRDYTSARKSHEAKSSRSALPSRTIDIANRDGKRNTRKR